MKLESSKQSKTQILWPYLEREGIPWVEFPLFPKCIMCIEKHILSSNMLIVYTSVYIEFL